MLSNLPSIIAVVSGGLLLLAALMWLWARQRKPQPKPLPAVWSLNPRPVFSHDERRLYRQLREALPQHVVLAKLPLVRFCQPVDPREVRYWFDLLGNIHVGFAICSPSGRVLAAVDIESRRGSSHRSQQVLEAVLETCKVRFLRCTPETLPSVPQILALLPEGTPIIGVGPMSPMSPMSSMSPTSPVSQARETLASTVASKRRERSTQWQESSFQHESFFGPDSRSGDLANTVRSLRAREIPVLTEEGGGLVIDGVPVTRH
jgi:hypothetical protein